MCLCHNGGSHEQTDASQGTTLYSPAECCGTRKIKVKGNPDMKQVSTCVVERQNLTMRMSMRRMTRLTNAFSKKIENQAHAMALHFMFMHSKLLSGSPDLAGYSSHGSRNCGSRLEP